MEGRGQSHKKGGSSDWKQVEGSRSAETGAGGRGSVVAAPRRDWDELTGISSICPLSL